MAVISTHKEGKHFYQFKFISVGEYFDIEIMKMPDYGKRDKSLTKTNRLPSQDGGWKIGFGIPEVVDTLDKADRWSKAWAKHTSAYILTGKEFPNERDGKK